MGNRNTSPAGAAEKAVDSKAALLSGQIIRRKFDGCFRVGEALDGAIHPSVQFGDFSGHAPFDGRRQMARDHFERRSRTFPEITAEFAAPILERGRLAPTG